MKKIESDLLYKYLNEVLQNYILQVKYWNIK